MFIQKTASFLHAGVQVVPLPSPASLLVGWEVVTDSNAHIVLKSILTDTFDKL